jgi:two-component system KDP operon response regulator KdpE
MPTTREQHTAGSILVIDDEPQIRRVVRNALSDDGYQVLEASSAAEGIDLAAAEQPVLIVLDLGLPDQDGLAVCRHLRGFTAVPIVVLSARHSAAEKEALLDAGADDYVTKPFSTVEFKARVRAHLRRASQAASGTPKRSVVVAHGVTIDLAARAVKRDGQDVHLLRTFVANPGKTLTHSHLFAAVWGSASGDAQQYLRVYVGQLRRKLETDPVRPLLIRTEPAVGYRFDADE